MVHGAAPVFCGGGQKGFDGAISQALTSVMLPVRHP